MVRGMAGTSMMSSGTCRGEAVVRIAVCHYMIGGGTPEQFLAELRHAAGLAPVRGRSAG